MALNVDSILEHLINFLGLLAQQTATKVDDEAVELLKAIHEDPAVRDWFSGVVDAYPDDGRLPLIEAPAEVQASLAARGFDWQKVLEALPILIALVRTFVFSK